jgi:hypothetical protein
MVLPFEGGLPPQVMGIDWGQRISFSRLLNVLSASEPSLESMGQVTVEELEIINPAAINAALLVGSDRSKVQNAYNGLVLPDDDYLAVAGSPRTLAERTMARTARSRKGMSPPDVTEAAKLRSAGHVLEKKVAASRARAQVVETENTAVKVVLAESKSKGAAHYKAGNLYPKVILARDTIEQMVEVAGKRIGWSVDDHTLAKNALYVQLLGRRGGGDQRTANWAQYGGDAYRYGRRRAAIIRSAASSAERELYKYKPALERGR